MQDLFPAETRLGELFVSPANMEILGFSDKNKVQVLYTSTIDNLFVIPECLRIKRSDDENIRVIRQNNMFGRGSLSLEYLNNRRSRTQGLIINTFERRGGDLARLLKHVHAPKM